MSQYRKRYFDKVTNFLVCLFQVEVFSMEMSASLKKATDKTNIEHNNRTEKERSKNIDPERSHLNKYLVQRDLKEVYKQEFGEALEKYNAKQKRNDRKIKDYYKHLQKGKKTAVQQEMILQIGDRNDFKNTPENIALANEILLEWFEGFKKRNPNLVIYNAVIHNDEESPHLHLNFVPVADGYKRGLERQVAFDRAIIQQDAQKWQEYQVLQERKKEFRKEQKKKGIKEKFPYKESEYKLDHPFEDWRVLEVSELERLMNERGIERKLVGTNEYEDVNELKQVKREFESLQKEIERNYEEIEKSEEIFKNTEEMSFSHYEKKTKLIKDPYIGKAEFEEKETGNVVLTKKQYKNADKKVRAAGIILKDYERLKSTDFVKENEKLLVENEQLKKELEREEKDYEQLTEQINPLIVQNDNLQKENSRLKSYVRHLQAHIDDLKRNIGLVYKNAKDYLQGEFELFKGMIKSNLSKEGIANYFEDHQEKEKNKKKTKSHDLEL